MNGDDHGRGPKTQGPRIRVPLLSLSHRPFDSAVKCSNGEALIDCVADIPGYEIMHVGDGEPLQLRRREGKGVGDRVRVADKQGQRLGAVRDEMIRRVVEPPQQHCNRLTWHPNTDEAHRRRAGYRNLGYIVAKNASPSRSIRSRSR